MSKARQAKLVALEAEDQHPFSNADEFESDLSTRHPDHAASDRLLQFWRSGFLGFRIRPKS
jgi:Tfp pilus assembly protein PilN